MKKTWLVTTIAAVSLFSTGTVISNSNTQTVEAKKVKKSKKAKRNKKTRKTTFNSVTWSAYIASNSIVYQNKKGLMQINDVKAYNITDEDGDFEENQINVYGSFTNNSNKLIKPGNFFDDHFRGFQVTNNKWHEINLSRYLISAASASDQKLAQNADDYVRPHQTVSFMLTEEEPQQIFEGQRIVIRAYKNTFGKVRASKNFYLSSIQSVEEYDEYGD